MSEGLYHCSVKSIGRGNGASVVQKAAYRAGVRLVDERTGEPADYRARGGVDETFIVARANAPAWAHQNDIGRLWNEAERAEPRVNGRTATEVIIALPHELDAAGRRQAAEDFVRPIVERYGVAAQVSMHAPDKEGDQRNWHAHILFTHRELGPDGFGDIANQRTMTRKRKGQEVQEKVAGIAATPADIKAIRKEWEQVVNRAYERAGLDIRVDHRSHKDRGIEQEPTKHLGPVAAEMEKDKPGSSDRAAVNREITQRNAARILAAMREAEVSQIKAEIIDVKADLAMQEARAAAVGRYDRLDATHQQVARDQFPGRYDDLRAAEPPPEVVRDFETNANRAAEPAAPIYDRDQDNAAWEAKLAENAINAEAQKARQRPDASAEREPRGAGPEPSGGTQRPEPEDMRPLGKTAGEIRMAWTLSRTAEELEEALAARGISLAEVSPEEARQSQRTAAFAKEVGNFARSLRAGEIVAIDQYGAVHRFDQRTTGDLRPEIEARFDGFAGIDRAGLLDVAATKEVMQEASRAAWVNQRQAEREQARPASWIEQRIAEYAEAARKEGATIRQDHEGNRVGGTEALADSLRPAAERETKEVKVHGAEAFAALLQDAGIVIARVTEVDAKTLAGLREDQGKERDLAASIDEIYQGNRIDAVLMGELAAVTRNGDVCRINPDKLGDAPRYLGDDLPSVIEARASNEQNREKTAEFWADLREWNAEARTARNDAYEGDRALHSTVNAGERGVENTLYAADSAVNTGLDAASGALGGLAKAVEKVLGGIISFFVGEPKLTRQQQHDHVRADTNEETLHARAYAAHEQAKEADQDRRMFEQNRQQQQEDFAARYGVPGGSSGRSRERDDDYDRGRERER